MAVYLPIRGLNRSSNVRVGNQKLTVDTTTYVDISDGNVRKALAHHSTLGQYIVVGGLTANNSDFYVETGAVVDQGSSASDLIVGVSAGDLVNRATGARVNVAATTTAATLAAADTTNGRIDLVVADGSTGAVTAVTGTPAATPVAPTTPAGKVPLATVTVAANATGVANAAITDVRPKS